MMSAPVSRRILITGAAGYIGGEVVRCLGARGAHDLRIVATDVRKPSAAEQPEGVVSEVADVRDPSLVDLLRRHQIDTVVHLASIVTPPRDADRQFAHDVDVNGTANVLACSVAAGVTHLVATSSGAAYGYHADAPVPLNEDAPLRANREFAYADHKRQIEELLARYRSEHPELGQLIFRPGVVLGARTDNQITDLFKKPVLLAVRGRTNPWTFIWDQDVVECIVRGIDGRLCGTYNLVGDGMLSLREIARLVGKPYFPVPAGLMRAALWMLKRLHATQYGPEQLDFLRYRPVLDNTRLKTTFGYTPKKTSEETLRFYLEQHRAGT